VDHTTSIAFITFSSSGTAISISFCKLLLDYVAQTFLVALKTLICMLILIFHFDWVGMMVWKIDIAF
jgi:hypothetical protein